MFESGFFVKETMHKSVDIQACAEIKKNEFFFSPYLTEEQTISKWEKGLSVPDAEMLVRISEILNVSVSELLGENIVVEQNSNLSAIAVELQKLNELLVIQQEQKKIQQKKIVAAVSAILLVLFIIAIYDQWNEMFYEFGRNLYKWFH